MEDGVRICRMFILAKEHPLNLLAGSSFVFYEIDLSCNSYSFLSMRSLPVAPKLMLFILTSTRPFNFWLNCGLQVRISGRLCHWFKLYLSDQSWFVASNNQPLNLLPVLSDVLQSNILGPLLFLIYINDTLYVNIHSSLLIFADAIKCFGPVTNSTDEQLL